MQVCFIGHRYIEKTKELLSSLEETVRLLLEKGVDTFLFGSKSTFDDLSWEIVTKIKEEFPLIKRVYVRSANQHIDEAYKKYLLNFYEETYFPLIIEKAGKSSYVERNYEMIDKSNYCVFYYNVNYVPTIRKNSKNNLNLKRNSGTKIAFEYAIKKKKEIINLYK